MVTSDVSLATEPEEICYNELVRRGLREGVDFTFQTAQFGGRLDRGGIIVDFDFINPPDLAFAVQGEYFHYQLRGGTRLQDLAVREELALLGQTLIFIDEGDLLRDPQWVVGEALQYRDHSRLARGY